MIINSTVNTLETSSNLNSVKEFTISVNAKMFDMLSSSIYKNKIKAVTREVICNAYDASKEANTSKQFEVYIPTSLNPEFVVKDYGTGMDENTLLTLYTSFGSSSKSSSNDFIGGFGIGSKSPFAYTDAFTVESVKDGVEVIAACYKDASGVPHLSVVHKDTDSNKPNGVTVRVPVKSNTDDFREFEKEAINVLTYFPKDSYKVFGLSKETAVTPSEPYFTPSFCTPHSYAGEGVVMGHVFYSFRFTDTTLLKEVQGELTEEELKLLKTYIYKFTRTALPVLPVGTLEISNDRENIIDSRRNRDLIRKHLLEEFSKVVEIAKGELKKVKVWNYPLYQKFRYFEPLVGTANLFENDNVSINWYGGVTVNLEKTPNTGFYSIRRGRTHFNIRYMCCSDKSLVKIGNVTSLEFVFVYNPERISKASISKRLDIFKVNQNYNFYHMSAMLETPNLTTEAQVRKFLKNDSIKVVFLDTIEIPKADRKPSKKSKPTVSKINSRGSIEGSIELHEGLGTVYYVNLFNGSLTDGWKSSYIQALFNAMGQNLSKKVTIVAIPKTLQERALKLPNLKPLEELNTYVLNSFNQKSLEKLVARREVCVNEASGGFQDPALRFLATDGNLPKTHPIVQSYKRLKALENLKGYSRIQHVVGMKGFNYEEVAVTARKVYVPKVFFIKDYPLLRHVILGSDDRKEYVKDLRDYVNLIDNNRQEKE